MLFAIPVWTIECVQGWICKTPLVNGEACMRTFTDKPLIMEHIKEKHADKGRICKVLIRKKPDEKSTPAIGNGTGNGERSQKPNKTHAPFAHTPMSLGITCKFCPKNPAFRNIQQLEVS